ncbi:hypothetical protein H311_03310 [Anncaliia algerae PRA109]|nr:hypothetical protein H311_03310 [Anncaliia algerae PRA109]
MDFRIALEERTEHRKIIYVPLENRKKEALINIIRKFVLPGSIIYTDYWKAYFEFLISFYITMKITVLLLKMQ